MPVKTVEPNKPEELNKTKKTAKTKKPLTERDLLKYEIAAELGLTDKVAAGGWGSLTSKESGRVGGILAKRIKKPPL